ncbi:MAG: hypothetical protein V3W41_05340 [Planctomycetota bacterium]
MDLQKFKDLSRLALEVTDDLGIDREAVSIPLDLKGQGNAVVQNGNKLVIIGPSGDLAPFIERLPALLEALDLSAVPTFP